ncbi:MAG: DUF1896 domain-containing protein [Alistipes sp.]|nr:DUF1896 domain-containing protein [Alistipes sp.]
MSFNIKYTKGVSYFAEKLRSFIAEFHPEKVTRVKMVERRSYEAERVYEQSIKKGDGVANAIEKAEAVLYRDLIFSKYDTLKRILTDELPRHGRSSINTLIKELGPVCEPIFRQHVLSDDFYNEPEYNRMITELHLEVREFLDRHGIF